MEKAIVKDIFFLQQLSERASREDLLSGSRLAGYSAGQSRKLYRACSQYDWQA